jgi:hypothetical protein
MPLRQAMTEAEKYELKSKIKKVMVDHLTTLGYPDMTPKEILDELKPMWIKLEEAGLIMPGMNFMAFHAQALEKAMLADINSMFGI